jgi:flavin-binding protein dodecin
VIIGATLPKRSAPMAVTEPRRGGEWMTDNIYKVIEIVGSSTTGIEDAVEKAIARASESLHDLRWFEIKETRGHIEEGRVAHYQVTLRVGFTLTE